MKPETRPDLLMFFNAHAHTQTCAAVGSTMQLSSSKKGGGKKKAVARDDDGAEWAASSGPVEVYKHSCKSSWLFVICHAFEYKILETHWSRTV